MDEVNKKNYDLEYKIITLGDSGVGKTSIINRFIHDTFSYDEITNWGIKFSFKILKTYNDKYLKLNIIDTVGQEKYRSLSISYFRNVDVVLFIFDLSVKLSFENMQEWINTFNNNNNGKYVKKKYLIGNKSDLGQEIEQKLIDEFAKKNELPYCAISAKSGNQIYEIFEIIANDLVEYEEKKTNISVRSQRNKVLAKTQPFNKKEKKSCC